MSIVGFLSGCKRIVLLLEMFVNKSVSELHILFDHYFHEETLDEK